MTGIIIGVGISENTNYKSSNTISEEELRQQEYEIAKNFCDTPLPPGQNKCSTLSKPIDHAEECIDLYEKWDEKSLKGRHDEKILNWKTRLNNLKEESKRKCGHSTFS